MSKMINLLEDSVGNALVVITTKKIHIYDVEFESLKYE